MSEQEVFEALKYRTVVSKRGDRYYRNADRQLHRTDGPAVELADGTKFWYQHGKLHREDGPAMVYPNGMWSWYLDGVRYTEHNFRLALESRCKIMLQQRVPGQPSSTG